MRRIYLTTVDDKMNIINNEITSKNLEEVIEFIRGELGNKKEKTHSKRIEEIGNIIEHSIITAITVIGSGLIGDDAKQAIRSKSLKYMVDMAKARGVNRQTITDKITVYCNCTIKNLASATYKYVYSYGNDTEIWDIMKRGASQRNYANDMLYIKKFKYNMNKSIKDLSRKR